MAAGLGLALVFGFPALRLRLPALLGYLLAGILTGPFTPGFVAGGAMASQLAEIGVMLLMFGGGLPFSLDELLAVRRVAVPGAVVPMAVATALESRGLLDSINGRSAVGWLIVEDLARVLLPPPLGGRLLGQGGADAGALWKVLGLALAQVGVFVALMMLVGRRFFQWWRRSASLTAPRRCSACRLRWKLFCRHGDARMPVQPPGGRGIAAAARRLRGAFLRLGRHAV